MEIVSSLEIEKVGENEVELLRAVRREVGETGEGEQVPVPGVVDCYILHEDTVGCSDHCPVMLIVRVK